MIVAIAAIGMFAVWFVCRPPPIPSLAPRIPLLAELLSPFSRACAATSILATRL